MSIAPFLALACPLDGEPLRCGGASWRCGAGHSFDVASQGYVHLLPVQHKRSLDPGDSKAMVAARRRFLDSGAYRPIADAANRAVLAELPANAALSCLDAGCGEGYYLRQLAAAGEREVLALLGLDISKWAVQSAARRERHATWVVASNARLPVLSATLDRVLCLFGFPVHAEFARVLKPGGLLVEVDPGPDHLRELRQIIYPTLRQKPAMLRPPPAGFTERGRETIRYSLRLDGRERIADLLAMTPHLHRAGAERREKASALCSLTVTVDVRLALFARTGDAVADIGV